MSAQIESNKILIRDAFERWYRVPEYQRPYVWSADEVSDLLDDIKDAMQERPDSQYFLGSIVFQTRAKIDPSGSNYEEDDLLDGQQRLTTCLLLHAVGRDLTTNTQLRDSCHKAVFQDENPFDGIPERMRIVYDIRVEVRDFVQEFIKKDGGTDDEDALRETCKTADLSVRNMAAAVIQIRDYFRGDEAPDLLRFFTFFRNRVLLIYVSSTQLEDAFRLFTVLNDRGMKLRNSDILKTLNLQALRGQGAGEQDLRDSAQLWEEIENELGEEFDTFLQHVRTVLIKEKAKQGLLQEFEGIIYKATASGARLLKPGKDTFQLLKRYKGHLVDILSGDHHAEHGNWEFDNLITLLREVARADIWIPPLLSYREVFGTEHVLEFLILLENKFSADWILRSTPTARIEAMNRILKDIDRVCKLDRFTRQQQIEELLKSPVFKYDANALLAEIGRADLYGQRYATYLLYKVDLLYGGPYQQLQPPRQMSIEHVLPQNPAANSVWRQHFADSDREEWTNRLGNLVLIGRRKNTTLGRLDFADKKQRYFQGHIQSFPNSLRVIQTPQWQVNDVQVNHLAVLAKLQARY